jgi:2'-5' RNA ligase
MDRVRRLFFALWPTDAVREALVEEFQRSKLQDAVGGRPVPGHNLHLTLVFLGNVPVACVDDLIDAAGALDVPGRCVLRLDRFGCFPAARVAWLGADPEPEAVRWVAGLSRRVKELGLPVEGRPWRPHVTLLRRIEVPKDRRDPAEVGHGTEGGVFATWSASLRPIEWPMTSFSLIESISGRPYQVLRTWPVE